MAILIMCSNPACGELFDVPDDQAGLPARCPVCGTVQAPGKASTGGATVSRPTYAKPAASPAPAGAQPPKTPASQPVAAPPPKSDTHRPAAGRADDEDIELIAEDAPPATGMQPAPPAAAVSQTPLRYRPSDKDLADSYKTWLDTQKQKQESPSSLLDSLEEASAFGGSIEQAAPAGAAQEPSDGVLEHRSAARAIFIIGGLGMAVGAAIGLRYGWSMSPTGTVLSVYIGTAIGWVAGFILAFLFVMTAERSEGKVRCGVCGQVYAEGAEQCNWCGSAIGPTPISPLAVNGMLALGYATSNALSIAWVAILTGLATLLGVGIWQSLSAEALGGGVREALIGLSALLGLILWSTAGRLFLDAVAQSASASRKAPDPPSPIAPATLLAGLKLLAIVVVYLLPAFTMPLLPVSLLLAAQGSGSLRPDAAERLARQKAKEFAILWLVLLVWLAGLTLATAISWGLWRATAWLPAIEGFSGAVFQAVLAAVGAAFYAAVVTIFGLAIARCIGLFGKNLPKRGLGLSA